MTDGANDDREKDAKSHLKNWRAAVKNVECDEKLREIGVRQVKRVEEKQGKRTNE